MNHPSWREWAGVAVIVPVVSMLALWAARRIGQWIAVAMARSFAGVVLDVMAPDMAHLGTKVTTALDELRVSNTGDHVKTSGRLVDVEHRLTEVETRLAGLERIAGRTPQARTRATDNNPIGDI